MKSIFGRGKLIVNPTFHLYAINGFVVQKRRIYLSKDRFFHIDVSSVSAIGGVGCTFERKYFSCTVRTIRTEEEKIVDFFFVVE
jgi:hypothetical protein